VDPKTSSLRPKAGSPAEDSKTNSPKRPTPPQEPQTSLSTTEISELVEEVLNHSLEPAITRVLSAALLTKNKKARKRSCPLSDALRTSVRSVLENDPGVLAAIQDRLGTTEEQDETITEEDVVELIREECLTLVRGFSDTAQVPEAEPSRPLKRRKRQTHLHFKPIVRQKPVRNPSETRQKPVRNPSKPGNPVLRPGKPVVSGKVLRTSEL
jgi:hypothetical protein